MTLGTDGLGLNSSLGLAFGVLIDLTADGAGVVLVVTGLGAGGILRLILFQLMAQSGHLTGAGNYIDLHITISNHVGSIHGDGMIGSGAAVINGEYQVCDNDIGGDLSGSAGIIHRNHSNVNGGHAVLAHNGIAQLGKDLSLALFNTSQGEGVGIIGHSKLSAHIAGVILDGYGNLHGIALVAADFANDKAGQSRQNLRIGISADSAGSGDGTGLQNGGLNSLIRPALALGALHGVSSLAADARGIVRSILRLGVLIGDHGLEVTLHGNGSGTVLDGQSIVLCINNFDRSDLNSIVAALHSIVQGEFQVGDHTVGSNLNRIITVGRNQSNFNSCFAVLAHNGGAGNDQSILIALLHSGERHGIGIIGHADLSADKAGVIVQSNRHSHLSTVQTFGIAGGEPGGEGTGHGGIFGEGLGCQSILVLPDGCIQQILGEADEVAVYIGVKGSVYIGGNFLLILGYEGNLNRQTLGTGSNTFIVDDPGLSHTGVVQLVELFAAEDLGGGNGISGTVAQNLGCIGQQVGGNGSSRATDNAEPGNIIKASIIGDDHIIHGQGNAILINAGDHALRCTASQGIAGDQQVLNNIVGFGHLGADDTVAPLGAGTGDHVVVDLHAVDNKSTYIGADQQAVVALAGAITVQGVAGHHHVLEGNLLIVGDLADNTAKAVGAVILGKGTVGKLHVLDQQIVAGDLTPEGACVPGRGLEGDLIEGHIPNGLHVSLTVAKPSAGQIQAADGMALTIDRCCNKQVINHVIRSHIEVGLKGNGHICGVELIMILNSLQIFNAVNSNSSTYISIIILDQISVMTYIPIFDIFNGNLRYQLNAGSQQAHISGDLLGGDRTFTQLGVGFCNHSGQSSAVGSLIIIGVKAIKMSNSILQCSGGNTVVNNSNSCIAGANRKLIAIQRADLTGKRIGDIAGSGEPQSNGRSLGSIKVVILLICSNQRDLTGLGSLGTEGNGLGSRIVGVVNTSPALAADIVGVQQPCQLTAFIIGVVQLILRLGGMSVLAVQGITGTVSIAKKVLLITAVITQGTGDFGYHILGCREGIPDHGIRTGITGDTAGITAGRGLRDNITHVVAVINNAGAGHTCNTGGAYISIPSFDGGLIIKIIEVGSTAGLADKGSDHRLIGSAGLGNTDGTALNTKILNGSTTIRKTKQTDPTVCAISFQLDQQVFEVVAMTVQSTLEGNTVGSTGRSHCFILHVDVIGQVKSDTGKAVLLHIKHRGDLHPVLTGRDGPVLSVVKISIDLTLGELGIIGIGILQGQGSLVLQSSQVTGLIDSSLDHRRSLLLLLQSNDRLGIGNDLCHRLFFHKEGRIIIFIFSQNAFSYCVVGIGNNIAQNNILSRHGKGLSSTALGDGGLIKGIVGDLADGNSITGMIILINGFSYSSIREPLLNGHLASCISLGSENDITVHNLIELGHAAIIGKPVSSLQGTVRMIGTDRFLVGISVIVAAGHGSGGIEVVNINHIAVIVVSGHIADLGRQLTDGTNRSGGCTVLHSGHVGPAVLDGHIVRPSGGKYTGVVVAVYDSIGHDLAGGKHILNGGDTVRTLHNQRRINIPGGIAAPAVVILRKGINKAHVLDHSTGIGNRDKAGNTVAAELFTIGRPVLDHMVLAVKGDTKAIVQAIIRI